MPKKQETGQASQDSSRDWYFRVPSFLIAALGILLYTRNLVPASTLLFSIAALALFALLTALFYSLAGRFSPVEGNRRLLLWLGVLGAAGILTLLLSPVIHGFLSPAGGNGVSADGFRVYEDPALGFSIAYPGEWTPLRRKGQDSDLVTNIAFISRDGKTVATVQVTDLSQPGYLGVPLDMWVNRSVGVLASNAISSQFRLLRNERTVFAGYPAQVLDYTVVLNSGDRIRTAGYLLEAGSKGYHIGFTSREDLFDDTAGTRQQIFGSFTITG